MDLWNRLRDFNKIFDGMTKRKMKPMTSCKLKFGGKYYTYNVGIVEHLFLIASLAPRVCQSLCYRQCIYGPLDITTQVG